MIKFLASFFDEHSPEDDIQRGFIAGLVCWVFSFIALFWIPQVWIDLVILTLCLYGLHKQNKWAATILFLFYTASKVLFMIETGKFTGLWSLIFIYLFYRAMMAAFRIHSDGGGMTIAEVIDHVNANACPKCKARIEGAHMRCMDCGASLVVNK